MGVPSMKIPRTEHSVRGMSIFREGDWVEKVTQMAMVLIVVVGSLAFADVWSTHCVG